MQRSYGLDEFVSTKRCPVLESQIFMQDAAMLEADAAKAYSLNQQLNKQQVALSNEVRPERQFEVVA